MILDLVKMINIGHALMSADKISSGMVVTFRPSLRRVASQCAGVNGSAARVAVEGSRFLCVTFSMRRKREGRFRLQSNLEIARGSEGERVKSSRGYFIFI